MATTKLNEVIQVTNDPLQRLPYDIWVYCLRFAAYDTAAGPLPFLGVSSCWKYHIIEAAELWTHIQINDSEDLLARVETFLCLSKTRLLDVTIRLPFSEAINMGSKYLLDNASQRLQSIFFDVDDRQPTHFIPCTNSPTSPSFPTIFNHPSSHSQSTNAPEGMLNAALRLLSLGDRHFPHLTSITSSSEVSDLVPQSATSPPALSQSFPRLSFAPWFKVAAKADKYPSATTQTAPFILIESVDIDDIVSRDAPRCMAIVDLDETRSPSPVPETATTRPSLGTVPSSVLEVLSLTTNKLTTLPKFLDMRHPLLHTLTLDLPMSLGRYLLSFLPFLPYLRQLALAFSHRPVSTNVHSPNYSLQIHPPNPLLSTPFSISSGVPITPLPSLQSVPRLDSLRITDQQLFSTSQDLALLLDIIANSDILNVARTLELETYDSIQSDSLVKLLHTAPEAEEVNLKHAMWDSGPSDGTFPELPRSGFVTPNARVKQPPKPLLSIPSVEMGRLRKVRSSSLGLFQIVQVPKLEKLICPHLQGYNLQSLPSDFGEKLGELHIDPKGFEVITAAVAKGHERDEDISTRFRSESVWSSLSRLVWSVDISTQHSDRQLYITNLGRIPSSSLRWLRFTNLCFAGELFPGGNASVSGLLPIPTKRRYQGVPVLGFVVRCDASTEQLQRTLKYLLH